MQMPGTIVHISEAEIRAHVDADAIIAAVEQAFVSLASGDGALFDIVIGNGSDPTHFFAIKSGRDAATGVIGLKAGSYNPGNIARGLPAHTSTTLLFDDVTGFPVALVDANYLNGIRTAAANAVATRRLAREDARTLSVIGFGAQAVFEVEAVLRVRAIDVILAGGRSTARAADFAAAVWERTGRAVEILSIEEAARRADILVTVTSAGEPLVMREWLRPGVHISAMGADNVGKQELDPVILRDAEVFVDAMPQAAIMGECQHGVAAGYLDPAVLSRRTMGDLVSGKAAGRSSPDAITVFDSSGTAIQDIAAAQAAMRIVLAARAATTDQGMRA